MTPDPDVAEFLIDPAGDTVFGLEGALEEAPPDPDRLLVLVRPEDIARLTPIIREAGIPEKNIVPSIHPSPGFIEVVEIPRPRLSFPW